MRHTPGPWKIKRTAVYDTVVANDDILISFIGIRENEEAQANNALIAAAPDMYEALKQALPWMGKLIADEVHLKCAMPENAVKAMELMQEAIAKAEG